MLPRPSVVEWVDMKGRKVIVRIVFCWVAVGVGPVLAAPRNLPNVRLFTGDYPSSVQNEQQLADYARHFADVLGRRADRADDPTRELDLRLLAANWILAYQIEPMATRMLLGMPEEQDAADGGGFASAAGKHLARADELLEQLAGKVEEAEALRSRRMQAEYLAAFAGAFEVLWRDDFDDDESRDLAFSDAASELSIVLEDNREEVAVAAQLWQAYLYVQRSRLTRAVDLLPAAISDPGGSRRYGLYARLMRCRLTAEMVEGAAASVALLARMEERCLTWFGKEDRRRAAQRTAALFRRQLTDGWGEALNTAGQTQRAQWCERMVSEIDRDYFPPPGPHEVLRLGRAIPAIVELDESIRGLEESDPAAPGGAATQPAEPNLPPPASTQGFEEEQVAPPAEPNPDDE